MPRSRPTAVERLLALFAALAAALGGGAAHAQTDPFALPTGVTAQTVSSQGGPGLSEIAVDGETRARLVDLAWIDGALTIDAEGARAVGLPIPATRNGKIALASLRIAKWAFDPLRQRLEVQLMRKSDGGNLIDMTQPPRQDGESTALTAFRLDYDLTTTFARGRSGAAALVEMALVRGNVSATSGFRYVSNPQPESTHLLRLDSQVQVLMPRAGITATAGDFISAGGQNQRALRMGGLQLASDYSLRPDLVTTPLPAFTGQVSVPTGIDIITGDQRYSLGEVQPGEFTVRNVPSNAGRGEVSVIVRDALGRETIQNAKFYMSRALLAPGLRQFALNLGYVRRRYGIRSHDYGPLAGNAFYRRGISSRLTLEGSGEWTSGLVNAGARGDLALGGIALVSLETRLSSDTDTGRKGSMVNLALESVGRKISARVSAALPSAGYRDVAAKLGDPNPPREFLGQISFNLKSMTQLQLSAGRQVRRFDPRYPNLEPNVSFANASFRTQLRRNVDIFASFGYRSGVTRSVTAWGGISVQLGKGRSSQASVNGGSGTPLNANAGFYRRDSEQQRLGYALEAQTGASSRLAAALSYRSSNGRVEAQAERVAGQNGLRVNARGTLLFAGGTVFARNQTGGSYALVRTGRIGGVTVLRENRLAGVTRSNGLLLVENIAPQVPLTFDIDPDKLPADALARATHRRVLVPRKAIGLVALDVVRFRPRQVRVTGPDGIALPVGTVMVAQPSGEVLMVGFDSLIEVNSEGGDLRIERQFDNGTRCVVELAALRTAAPDQVPSHACRVELPSEFVARDPAGDRRSRRSSPVATRRH